MKYTLATRIYAFLVSIRPKTTPLGMISVYVGGLVAGAVYYSSALILAVASTFFVTAASMMFNDYFDRDIDLISHPERPIPKGIIRPKEMLTCSIAFFMIGLAVSLFVNLLCFGIAVISVLLITSYELYSKNKGILSNITVAFISSLSFTFGGAVVGKPLTTFVLSILTFFAMTGREIIMDIRDTEGDKLMRRSLPVQIGKRNASYVADVFLIASLALTPLPYLLGILNLWYLVIIVPVGVIILVTVLWMLRDIKNAARSASVIRIALAIALVGFIAGIVL